MAEEAVEREQELEPVDDQAVAMHERVILAFLARPSDFKKDDQDLLDLLESPLAKQVAKALADPEQTPPPDEKISRLAERLFLDARNFLSAEKLRVHSGVHQLANHANNHV